MAFYARALRRFPRKALNISIHESRQKPLYFFMLTRQNSSDTILSPAESAKKYNWKCRQDLATAFRGLDMYGLSEGVCTHLTMMAPALNGNGDVMLMIPYGLHWSQATPSSLIGLNDKCELVEGQGEVLIEATNIHKGVHDARPDAVCVFHLHSPYTTALGMLEEEVFGMYHQTHCCFYNDFAYDSHFEGAAKHCTEGERLAKLIGDKAVLFMANHGMIAMQTGKKLRKLPDEISSLTYKQIMDELDYYANSHFEGIKAALLQKDPEFLNQ